MALARRSSRRAPAGARSSLFPLAACLLFAPAARAEIGGALDNLDLSSPVSCAAHGVALVGGRLRSDRAQVGTRLVPVRGVLLPANASLTADLAASGAPADGLTLFCVLSTSPSDYGKPQHFRLRLNGRELADVCTADPGGGVQRTLAFPVPTAAAPYRLTVEAMPDSAAPITVAALRLCHGLSAAADQRMLATGSPLALALVSRQAGGLGIDAGEAKALFEVLSPHPLITRQTAVLFDYSSGSPSANREKLHALIGVPLATGIPLRVLFRSDGVGAPAALPDGAGGTFADLPYRQIAFRSGVTTENATLKDLLGNRYAPGFEPAAPGPDGATPLTLNHPRLNQLRRNRLTAVAADWRREREQLALAGKERLLPLGMGTGDRALYATTTGTTADFNPWTILDAMEQQVDLDARNGLSWQERWWLHQNRAKYEQKLATWLGNGLGPEPAFVTGASSHGTSDSAARNLFTEPDSDTPYPFAASAHPAAEAGSVKGACWGADFHSPAALPVLLKAREHGRTALPYMNAQGMPPAAVMACLQAAFATGARYAVLDRMAPDAAGRLSADLVSAALHPDHGPAMVTLPPVPGKAPTVRAFTAPQEGGLLNTVTLYPVANSPRGTQARVILTHLKGKAKETLSWLVPFPAGGPARCLLPAPMWLQPGERYELTARTGDGRALAPAADGALAVRLDMDLLAERARSLAIQAWGDAEGVLSDLQSRMANGKQCPAAAQAVAGAQRLLAAGEPRAAYAAACRAEQFVTPAAFVVTVSKTRLPGFGVDVESSGPLKLVVAEMAARAITLRIRTEQRQHVRVAWHGGKAEADTAPGRELEMTIVEPGAPPVAKPPAAAPHAPAKPAAAAPVSPRIRLSLPGPAGAGQTRLRRN